MNHCKLFPLRKAEKVEHIQHFRKRSSMQFLHFIFLIPDFTHVTLEKYYAADAQLSVIQIQLAGYARNYVSTVRQEVCSIVSPFSSTVVSTELKS